MKEGPKTTWLVTATLCQWWDGPHWRTLRAASNRELLAEIKRRGKRKAKR